MSFGAIPLLERYPVFRSRDTEKTRAFLVGKAFRFDMDARRGDRFDARLNGVYLPGMYLGYIDYGSAVATRATMARSDYWIQLPLRGQIEVAAGRDIVDCTARCAAVTSPLREALVRSPACSSRIHLSLTGEALIRQLTTLLGDSVDLPLEFASMMPLARGYGRTLAQLLRVAVEDLDGSSALLSSAIMLRAFEQLVMTGLLLSHPHNYVAALRRRERPIAPRDRETRGRTCRQI